MLEKRWSSPNVICPQGDLQFSQDLGGFLDTPLKLPRQTNKIIKQSNVFNYYFSEHRANCVITPRRQAALCTCSINYVYSPP